MDAGNLIFLLLIVGGFVAMFSMRRGGHGHSGMEGGGCCGGGHSHEDHSGSEDSADQPVASSGGQTVKPLLGPPGTGSAVPPAAPAQGVNLPRFR